MKKILIKIYFDTDLKKVDYELHPSKIVSLFREKKMKAIHKRELLEFAEYFKRTIIADFNEAKLNKI